MSDKIRDMIIIGSGPAGLGTALYAKRAGLDVLVIEKAPMSGGQIINTTEVDNYLGLPGIGGFEMGDAFKQHVDRFGVEFAEDEIISVSVDDAKNDDTDGNSAETPLSAEATIKTLTGKKDTYRTYTLVFAMGAEHSKLGIPGEEEFGGKGVSYCATCDGAFFRGKDTVVIGGGDVAVEDAAYLAGLCSHVTLVHRRDELRAAKSVQDQLFSHDNVGVEWNSVADHIEGNDRVSAIVLKNVKDGTDKTVEAAGVFIAVGMNPESALAEGICDLDERGYIIAGEDCTTSAPGIYAAGDIRTKQVRQVITAVADGACVVASAEKHLRNLRKS